MRLRMFIGLASLVSLTVAPGVSRAQRPAPAAQTPLTRTASHTVVAEVRRLIAAHYVIPAVRPALDTALRNSLEAGRFDVGDPALLAERINADLQAASRDHHLNIQFNPARAAMVAGRQDDEVRDSPAWQRDARMRNHGVITMRMIPGNIRYVGYDNFVWTGPRSAEAIDVAMRFLKEGDAAIIDLRLNGGGSPRAVAYLISHFMEPNRLIETFHMVDREAPDRRFTVAELPAGRMIGKPLYVLISEHTSSAAEAFAGNVSGFRIGELVGANTAGMAYRNDLFNVGSGFVLSVSVGRPELASTGGDWEGRGIAPTIAVAADSALDAALAHALRRLAPMAPPEERADLESQATIFSARAHPITPGLPLAAYVGTFGERSVTIEEGRLFYRRVGGIESPLLPLGANLFALDLNPATRIEFAVSGSATPSFDLIQNGGRTTVLRTR